MSLHNGGYSNQTQDSSVSYNVALEVPVSVNGEITTQSPGDSNHLMVSTKLKSDSRATTTAPTTAPSAHPYGSAGTFFIVSPILSLKSENGYGGDLRPYSLPNLAVKFLSRTFVD